MALLTAKGISSVAVELLARTLVLPRTVTMVPGGEFAGSNGDTITVRVPQPSAAREQSTPGEDITFDDINEVPVDVQLTHVYHAKLVTDEELSLEIEDFARQITRIQVEAVARKAENELAAAMNAMTADAEVAADGSDVEDAILAAREFLGENDAPAGDRFLAVSPAFATFLLAVDKFTRVNESGSASALRDAILGRLYGFTVVESNALTGGTAVAYHRSGFCFANRVPVVPRGANDTATANAGGIGLRHIFQYVPTKLSDASVLSTFAGAAPVVEDESDGTVERAYKIETGSGS